MFVSALLAILWLSLLNFVAADDGNIAFLATINVTGITISDPYADVPQAAAALVGSTDTEFLTFVVPVTIERYLSSAEVVGLTVYARPYDYDEDSPPEEFVVFEQTVYVYSLPFYDVYTAFNITTNATDTPVYNFRATVTAESNEPERQSIDGLAVLSYDPETRNWIPSEVAAFAQQENQFNHEEHDAELAQASEPPIDTSGETVITDQEPDLPEDPGDGVVVEPVGEDVKPGTKPDPTKPDPTKPDPTKPDPTKPDPTKPDPNKPGDNTCCCPPPEPPKHCRDFHSWRRHNDGKPWKEEPAECKSWKRMNDGKPWKQEPHPPVCTPCPQPYDSHHKRQSTQRTTLDLKLFYGTSSAPVPIRQLKVTVFGIAGNKKLSAIGKTDNSGSTRVRFPALPDGPLRIYRLSVSLDAEKFRVSTSNDGGKTFLFWRRRSIPLDWEIDSGGTGQFSYRYMNKESNDVFHVQDRMLNSWIFAKTRVHNFKDKLPAVYFPGNIAANSFTPAETVAGTKINVHPDKARATSPLAHEYGHWFHYLTRGGASLESGPDGKNHGFCQAGITSTISALKEGYATAFGISSLWQSKFQETTPAGGVGTGYCFWPFPDTGSQCREIENYDCDAIPVADRDLSLDEGRVAATLRDLIDLSGDNYGNDTGKGVSGFSDALSGLNRRKVLYDPIRSNPTSMEEYW
jgi:hypothetical protein